MVALYRDGRQADALGAYRRARTVLAAEAGVDPGAVLRHLERAILDQAGTATLLRVVAPVTAARRALLTWLDASGVPRSRELPAAGRLVIGRGEGADVVLGGDAGISREHAAVVVDGVAAVTDLGSRNGTFHNGLRIDSGVRSPLRPGDLLRCGDTVLAVTGPPDPGVAPDEDTRTGRR